MIIFEGPEGGGKTTTAEFVSSRFSIPVYHTGGPPNSPKEAEVHLSNILTMNNTIFDRFPLFSEQIYGPLFRGKSYISENTIKCNIKKLLKIKHLIIYCRPQIKTLLKLNVATKPHKPKKYCDSVAIHLYNIINTYDLLMYQYKNEGIRIIRYNRDKTTPEALCAELTYILEKDPTIM